MRLAISNIAWDVGEDEEVAQLLARHGVDAIDVAPTKYFPDPVRAGEQEIAAVKRWWSARGIEITGMQSLLFGTQGLNLFGPAEVQQRMLEHLAAVCRIGGALGGTRLVFGSPKNRDRSKQSDGEAREVALDFFRRLGDVARQHGVLICLEPNPAQYGANFMTTTQETAEVVEAVGHPAIKLQLDTGALAVNREEPAQVVEQFARWIGHVHASEPDLVPLGDGAADHAGVRAALERHLPGAVVSIEMLATRGEPHLTSIERALKTAVVHYRDPP